MYNRANYQSVVRWCLCLVVLAETASPSCAQTGVPTPNPLMPRSSNRSLGGWRPSQPTQNTVPGSRATYYQQLGDGLPSFPNNLPSQPISDLQSGGDLLNSLSDLPAGQPQLPTYNNDFANGVPADSLQYANPNSRAANDGTPEYNGSGQPYDFGLTDNGLSNHGIMESGQPPGRLVPVTPAAFQSGSNQVLPPQQQFPQQQNPSQFQPQQPMSGGSQLRPAREITTGLPYVTNAPAQRYPTSPYMGQRNVPMYVNAAYQRTIPVSNVTQIQGNAGSVLPQNLQPNPGPVYSPAAPGYYPTAYPQQCAPTLPPDGSMGAYVPPTITPNWNPNMYSPNNSGYRPFFSLGQENYNAVLGRGIIGQPVAYVPGQYVRNFLRYIFP